MNLSTSIMLAVGDLADKLSPHQPKPLACGTTINGIPKPTPSTKGIFGISTISDWMNNSEGIAVMSSIVVIFLGVAFWGAHTIGGSSEGILRGRRGIVVGIVGALVVGATWGIIGFAMNTGASLC